MEQDTTSEDAVWPATLDPQGQFLKDEMLALVAGGRSIKSVAEEYGINRWTLRNWVRAAKGSYKKKRSPGRPRKSVEKKPAIEPVEKVVEKLSSAMIEELKKRCAVLEDMIVRLTCENLELRGR